MEFSRLGKTNLTVSRLSLGAMSFGDTAWRSWMLDEVQSRAVVKRALDHQINVIDTCNFYSLGRSEEIVGTVIKDFVCREDIILATKVGNPMRKALNAGGFSRKHLFAEVDASLRRLKTDYIDLYQTHIWNPSTNLEEMVVAFDDLVRSGKVLYVGATDMPAWQFVKSVIMAEERGLAGFATMQNHYNLLWREDERELMPFCVAQGIGLMPYSPHARGMLCGAARRGDPGKTKRSGDDEYADRWYGRDSDRALADLVEALAKERGVKPGQIALAWVLSRPGIHSPVIGATRPEHIDDAVAALEIKLDAAECARLEQAYALRPRQAHA